MEIYKQENEDRLPKRVIQRDTDVTHLHLARRGLTYIPDLSRFSMLRCVWLNNNKIREVSRASFNCCLTELHLQNNDILSISGALRHLTCLQVLLLFNNQMKCLEETVSELKNMQDLHTLSLYLNPFTQDPEYHQYVLHHLPSVRFLDRKEVKQEERRQAFKLFSIERQRVLDTIAFGRRALPPPTGRKLTSSTTKQAGHHGSRKRCAESMSNHSDNQEKPSVPKSIIQFSVMNWTGTSTSQWNHLDGLSKPASGILTVKLR
ncbi:leucine-rich repeat-containing protein 72 isoform X2 [Carassius carassius]|uniref:leucine-rich repeat-containing protein 72 isoform X2 n=1 Tax=Carassius carassius TaxID=217509 RepID=UPI0028692BF2|nr:leucine-rich repeat-containing protein 72 isoform X2 [Carassius carassius]